MHSAAEPQPKSPSPLRANDGATGLSPNGGGEASLSPVSCAREGQGEGWSSFQENKELMDSSMDQFAAMSAAIYNQVAGHPI